MVRPRLPELPVMSQTLGILLFEAPCWKFQPSLTAPGGDRIEFAGQNRGQHTQTVLADVAGEVPDDDREVRTNDNPEVRSALGWGTHDSVEPVERGLRVVAPEDRLEPSLFKRRTRVALGEQKASRAQGVGYTRSPSRSTRS